MVAEGGSGDISVELQETFGENAAAGMVRSPQQIEATPNLNGTRHGCNQEYTFPAASNMFMPMDKSNLEPAEDMVKLGDLHEAALLHNVRLRFFNDDIFTYIGPILVAANPYKKINMFTPEFVDVSIALSPAQATPLSHSSC